MPNRYTRDELCTRALNTSQVANLIQHDMPAGTITIGAFTPMWLQEIIDFWHHMAPFSATVAGVPLTIPANTSFVNLPSDFVLDVRNGYLVPTVVGDVRSMKRVKREPFQRFLNRQLAQQRVVNAQYPKWYCVVSDDQTVATQLQRLLVTPTATVAVTGTLWYYKLPAILAGTDRPKMPSDYVCLEYLRIRCLEWARAYEPGTAQEFAKKVLGGMKAAGLLNEPEDDEIPFDEDNYVPRGGTSMAYAAYSWMGER